MPNHVSRDCKLQYTLHSCALEFDQNVRDVMQKPVCPPVDCRADWLSGSSDYQKAFWQGESPRSPVPANLAQPACFTWCCSDTAWQNGTQCIQHPQRRPLLLQTISLAIACYLVIYQLTWATSLTDLPKVMTNVVRAWYFCSLAPPNIIWCDNMLPLPSILHSCCRLFI